jgi:hypothetical protein
VDRRDIAVEDAGPDSGFPVIMMNEAGSRHLYPAAVREGRDLGLRLIGYSRPGTGRTTSRPGRVIADRADDLRAHSGGTGHFPRGGIGGSDGRDPPAVAGPKKPCLAMVGHATISR